jgi:hypothetical protein
LKGWIIVPLGLSEASLELLRAEAYALQPPKPNAQGNCNPPLQVRLSASGSSSGSDSGSAPPLALTLALTLATPVQVCRRDPVDAGPPGPHRLPHRAALGAFLYSRRGALAPFPLRELAHYDPQPRLDCRRVQPGFQPAACGACASLAFAPLPLIFSYKSEKWVLVWSRCVRWRMLSR